MLIETSGEPVAILDDARRFASISQDGNRRWIEWELSPIRAGGRPRGFLVHLRDLGAYLPVGSGYHKGPSDQ